MFYAITYTIEINFNIICLRIQNLKLQVLQGTTLEKYMKKMEIIISN